MLVRNLLEKYPDSFFHMMTPGGYVDLAPEQVKGLLKGESVKAHPGVPGYDMEMDAEELLNEKVHSGRLCVRTGGTGGGTAGTAGSGRSREK